MPSAHRAGFASSSSKQRTQRISLQASPRNATILFSLTSIRSSSTPVSERSNRPPCLQVTFDSLHQTLHAREPSKRSLSMEPTTPTGSCNCSPTTELTSRSKNSTALLLMLTRPWYVSLLALPAMTSAPSSMMQARSPTASWSHPHTTAALSSPQAMSLKPFLR